MRRKSLLLFFAFITLSISCSGKSLEATRPPAVADAFYPADKAKLSALIDQYLSHVPEQKVSTEILALIVPHAGYIYSGQVAAYGYKLLQHKSFDTVILIGPSHHQYLNVASIYTAGTWETPLGKVPIDSALAKAIAHENILFTCSDQAHAKEHSLEVQLPFLQKVLKNFKILPILVSNPSSTNCALLAQAIIKHCDLNKKYLFIISTDMSHYYNEAQAKVMDRRTLDLLKQQDIAKLSSALDTGTCELCGGGAVLTALEIARLKEPAKIKILKYATSGDATGDQTRVVGYTSAVVYQEPAPVEKEKKMLNQAQQQELLKIARKTIETYIISHNVPDFKVTDLSLIEKRGVFVTLHKEHQLRGCIGYIMPIEPLYLAVSKMAVESATADPRFPPVTKEELAKLEIEISVLTVPERVKNLDDIILGTHGVIVRKGGRGGVFLPQVATETGWSKEEFLTELCEQKAGLPAEAWKDPDTELYTFSAQVFQEKGH